MEIRTLHYLEGAKKCTGITVVIDVFRAFSTACFVAANGAELIIPIADIDRAYQLKNDHPDSLLIGERGGIPPKGFDFGNSPSAIEGLDFTGKIVVLTTSAGTQGLIEAEKHSHTVLTGSFVNAAATANWIRKQSPRAVSLICMGWNGKEPADEDILYAEYLEGLLTDKPVSFLAIRKYLCKDSNTMNFLKSKGSSASAQRDFELCLSLDRFDFVLRLCTGEPLQLVQEL